MLLTARVFDATRSSGARLDAYRIDDTFYLDIHTSDKLDTDRLEAKYDDGMLTVKIPVSEAGDQAAAG